MTQTCITCGKPFSYYKPNSICILCGPKVRMPIDPYDPGDPEQVSRVVSRVLPKALRETARSVYGEFNPDDGPVHCNVFAAVIVSRIDADLVARAIREAWGVVMTETETGPETTEPEPEPGPETMASESPIRLKIDGAPGKRSLRSNP